jgi:peptidase E
MGIRASKEEFAGWPWQADPHRNEAAANARMGDTFEDLVNVFLFIEQVIGVRPVTNQAIMLSKSSSIKCFESNGGRDSELRVRTISCPA